MAEVTSYTPTALGYGLDLASQLLYFPSQLVEGKMPPRRHLTTKYLLIQQYVDSSPEVKRCFKKLSDESCNATWSTIRRVIWAATIILPILDTLGALIRQLAKLDYAIKVRYDNQAYSHEQYELKREQKALKKSIREFAGYLLVISCKVKNSTYQGAPERTNDEQYGRFCSHFAGGDPKEAIGMCARSIISLLDQTYPRKSQVAERLYDAFRQIAASSESADWMKGNIDNPLHGAFQTIIDNYEPFYNQS